MIKCINKTLFIGLMVGVNFQLCGMLPEEKKIIDFMENPVAPAEGSLANADDIRGAYLLSFIGWKTLGTLEFKEALGEYIENPILFVIFRKFMEQSTPCNPSSRILYRADGSSMLEKFFYKAGHEYSMQQDSEHRGAVAILNKSLQCFHVLPVNAVYPQFIKKN